MRWIQSLPRSTRLFTSLGAIFFVACGQDGIHSLDGDPRPLAIVRGRLGLAVGAPGPTGNIYAGLLWAAPIGADDPCSAGDREARLDCLFRRHFVPRSAQASTALEASFPRSFEVAIRDLPSADVLSDDGGAKLALGLLVAFVDGNSNKQLDLLRPSGSTPADEVIAASRGVRAAAIDLIVFREGPLSPRWARFTSLGCAEPPLGFSVVHLASNPATEDGCRVDGAAEADETAMEVTGSLETRALVCTAENGACEGLAAPSEPLRIAAGGYWTCAHLRDQSVQCWGSIGPNGDVPAPSGTFAQVSKGIYHHACGLRPDGHLDCWGKPTAFPLGTLFPADPNETFLQIAAGGFHNCALRLDRTISCWGNSLYDQLSSPAGEFVELAAGVTHTCARRADDSVVCWGDSERVGPVPSEAFRKIAAGGATCGLRPDGTLVCWGTQPVLSPPPGQFVDISVGLNHACARGADGQVTCFGQDTNGATSQIPRERYLDISAGGDHTCGLQVDGRVVCAGRNDFGQASPPRGF